MKKPNSVSSLETLGRVRLSSSFFMRDFLYSEIAAINGFQNIPDFPDLAIEAGTHLCQELLEPLQSAFGQISIRSAYRSPEVNSFGNRNNLNCSKNETNYGHHIWDYRDRNGFMGATACIVVPWVWERHQNPGDWQKLAWWIHDHLPYSTLFFHPKYWAFNIQWHENPARVIKSYPKPSGVLTKPGMANFKGDHSDWYQGFPNL